MADATVEHLAYAPLPRSRLGTGWEASALVLLAVKMP
jgi:hypothetical protein